MASVQAPADGRDADLRFSVTDVVGGSGAKAIPLYEIRCESTSMGMNAAGRAFGWKELSVQCPYRPFLPSRRPL